MGRTITHAGFEAFAAGRFDDGGSNLYVNANGEIERIHRTDLTGDGIPDIVIPNTHGSLDRGPTRIFRLAPDTTPGPGATWEATDLPNESGWLSRVVDLDGDGHLDLIVVNGENGVTSELSSYVYWGGPRGLTGERTAFATTGAYDVVVTDLDGDGRLDLLLTNAWTDVHNEGRPRPLQALLQREGRQFADGTAEVGLSAVAGVALGLGDVLGRGTQDLVVANLRSEYLPDTDSFVYPGRAGGGFNPEPVRLPTRAASALLLADLDGDGRPEILFAGGDQVRIYWNGPTGVSPDRFTTIEIEGVQTQFRAGMVSIEVADVDGDGLPELLIAGATEIQCRRADALQTIVWSLPVPFVAWLHTVDVDGDGLPELVASVHESHASYDVESLVFWNGGGGTPYAMEGVSRLPVNGGMGATSADLDGDGRPELILNGTVSGPTSRWTEFPVFVYPGIDADARDFDPSRRIDLHSGGETYAYAVADLDLDGHADLVLARLYGVRIFPGGPDGVRPDRWYELPITTGYCMQVHVADLNRDGWLDLVALVQTYDDREETRADSTHIFWGGPDGFALERSTILPTTAYGAGYLADFDRDGALDLAWLERDSTLRIMFGGPGGLPTERVATIPLGTNAWALHLGAADLDGDGWLDIVVGIAGHYSRSRETLLILWGGPDGYDLARSTRYDAGYSPGQPTAARLGGDEQLTLVLPAYSSEAVRELPWELLQFRGREIDHDQTRRIQGYGSCHILPIDLDGDGWTDLLVSNHRRNEVHDADAIVYWGGPDGIDEARTTHLPGWGPHYLTMRDPGNAYDRGPREWYVSPPVALGSEPAAVTGVAADADVPDGTELTIELRVAPEEAALDAAPWAPAPIGSTAESTGPGRWAQYRAGFGSRTGARSPRLRSVELHLATSA
jgi:hypothetical protein